MTVWALMFDDPDAGAVVVELYATREVAEEMAALWAAVDEFHFNKHHVEEWELVTQVDDRTRANMAKLAETERKSFERVAALGPYRMHAIVTDIRDVDLAD